MKKYVNWGKETVTRETKEAIADSLSDSNNRNSPEAVSSQ